MTVGSGAPTLAWAADAADRIDTLVAALCPLGPAGEVFEGMLRTPDEPTREPMLGHEPDLNQARHR